MCGITGIVGIRDISGMILDSLRRLSYRGYDSSGIAIWDDTGGKIQCVKAPGKLDNLCTKLSQEVVRGNVGIGHTRWATHGSSNEIRNAHPHTTHIVAVAHNGIIENFQYIKNKLIDVGMTFCTETDSEVIPHLLTYYIERLDLSPKDAMRKAMEELEGAMSIIALFAGGNFLMAAKKNAPLILGYGTDCMFAASDSYAISKWTNRVSYLENNDIAVLNNCGITVFDCNDCAVTRQVNQLKTVDDDSESGKGCFAHYMLKEIYEQPATFGKTFAHYFTREEQDLSLRNALSNTDYLHLIGCGSAYYACRIGKWYIENMSPVRVNADIASEFRYSDGFIGSDDLVLFVSQSGETADTIAAMNRVGNAGNKTIGIINVPDSSLARKVDFLLTTPAGREVSVATTKAFTAQLVVFVYLALTMASARGVITQELRDQVMGDMMRVPISIEDLLKNQEQFYFVANKIADMKSVLYIGRGVYYSVALEGALKLREIAYIHGEAIAAGELKHGSIALIDDDMPVVAICPCDDNFDKMVSNIQEVKARSGFVIVVTDAKGAEVLGKICDYVIVLPSCGKFGLPILYSIAMQLLAYYVGVHREADIDQPRNLAKSVTVE